MPYIFNGKEINVGRKKYLIAGLAVVVLFVLAGGYLLSAKRKALTGSSTAKLVNYTIPDVPYFGLYNHIGKNSYLGQKTSASAIAMLLEYWNPGENNFDEIRRSFDPRKQEVSMDDVKKAIDMMGDYSTKGEHLEMGELGKYINTEKKTPLLLFLPLDKNQAVDVEYNSTNILIGVNSTEKKLILHSYWFGNNYEMSFDEYNELLKKMAPALRNYYIVVQPKNLQVALESIDKRASVPYPARTSVMSDVDSRSLIKDYAIGLAAFKLGNKEKALQYFGQAEKAPKFFEKMPPFLKVELYYYEGSVYAMQGGDDGYKKALEYAQKAIDLNRNLDKSFLDWPGYGLAENRPSMYGVDSKPYVLAGDAYLGQNRLSEAKKSYEKGLDICPKDAELKGKITALEEKIKI